MALNYRSCSFRVNEDCGGMMRGCGGQQSEDASPLSSCGVSSLWLDELELELQLGLELEEDEEEFDPADLLPTDPFGMNLETAIANCIGDLTGMSADGRFGDNGGDAVLADLSYYLSQAFALSPELQIGGYGGIFDDSFVFGGLSVGGGDPFGFLEDPCTSGNAALACCNAVDTALVQEGIVPHVEVPFGFGSLSVGGGDSFGFVEDPSTSGNAALMCCDAVDDVPVQEGTVPHEDEPFGFGCLSVGGGDCFGFVEDPSTSGNTALACCDAADAIPVQEGSVLHAEPFGFECLSVGGDDSFGFVKDPLTAGNNALLCCDVVDAVPVQEGSIPHEEAPFGFGGISTGGGDPFGFVEDPCTAGNSALPCCDVVDAVPVEEEGVPHEGMMFALGYLGLRDILSVEMVCKSLCLAVRNDPLLWKCIHIESHFSKICDADLLHLTRKSPDTLQCLSLDCCLNITDQGLKAVLESSPTLTKLSILNCSRLTIDGLISNLKLFNMKAVTGIKQLRVGTNFSLPKEYYEELLSLMNIDKMQELHNREPRFFRANQVLSDCNDGYALDIEMCPICQNYKLVYDCPEEGCNARKSGNCRGCTVCIMRCYTCARCVGAAEFHESFTLDWFCPNCKQQEAPSLAQK